jgi:hypothetical protein
MLIQALKTNTVKKRHVIIKAENLKNNVSLWDSVFPLSHDGHLNKGKEFSDSDLQD